MNWDEDIDLLVGKKTSAKQGRRSSNVTTPPDDSDKVFTPPEAPRRKTGGWAEETTKSAKSKGGTPNLIEQERFQTEASKEKDDIPEIPDIDDLQDDALNLSDVTVPTIVVKKSTYKELDNQFEHLQAAQPSFGNLGDIDLSFLTSKLYPEKDVQRPNEVWTMESLYQDIKSYNAAAE